MPLPNKPLRIVVAIVSFSQGSEGRQIHELWGTGFFVAPKRVMSAKHVLGVELPSGHMLGAIGEFDGEWELHLIDNLKFDSKNDVAVGTCPSWPTDDHLLIEPTNDYVMNSDVYTIEFSPTEFLDDRLEGSRRIHLNENWHKGHVVRLYDSELGHAVLTPCLELSYPAFLRASGAPVMVGGTGHVTGMIVSNIERQLLPAHIERVARGPDVVDEVVRYHLPRAEAIRASRLRTILASLDR